MTMFQVIFCLLIFCQITAPAALRLKSVDDQQIAIDGDSIKATAFVFVTNVCPIANAYQPRLRELQQQFGDKGIQFVEVYPVAGITKDTVIKHRREFDIRAQCVLDADRQVARILGAKVTPEVIVVGRDGVVLYRGSH